MITNDKMIIFCFLDDSLPYKVEMGCNDCNSLISLLKAIGVYESTELTTVKLQGKHVLQ